MKFLKYVLSFLIITGIAFGVDVLISYAYDLIAHDSVTIDWVASLRLALILGIVIPLINVNKKPKIKSK
jgi:hypothetical protein